MNNGCLTAPSLRAEAERMKQEETPPAGGKTPLPRPRRRFLRRCLSLFGLASLSYVLGAAVMFFQLPSSAFLPRAFVGGAAWYETVRAGRRSEESLPPLTVGQIDRPDKTCDGFTLLMYGGNSQAVLVNMRGDVVHRWPVPFSRLSPPPPSGGTPVAAAAVYFTDDHLYPNEASFSDLYRPLTHIHTTACY